MPHRPPFNIDVSCTKSGRLDDLAPSFNFIVMLNQFTYGFQEVSNFSRNRSHDFIEEGGNPHRIFVEKPGGDDLPTLNLKRGVMISSAKSKITSAALAAAAAIPDNLLRKTALLALASTNPSYALEHGPAIGFVQVYDRFFKKDIVTFSFFSLGAVQKRMTDLDAMNSSNILIEEIEIIHTGLTKLSTNII